MSEAKEYGWLAAYLFYNEPWEDLLTDAVLPYVQTTLKTGIAQGYFFIRYWERGPHIRLRFFGRLSELSGILKPNLTEHFQSYFISRPSERPEPDYPENYSPQLRWRPNNSIHFETYKPERERYGGEKGLALSEKQFFYSSKVVLHYLEKNRNQWDYEMALGTAIKLHLCQAFAQGMDRDKARAFFHFYFYNWLPQAMPEPPLAKRATQTRDILEAFERSFEEQRTALVSFHRDLWQALHEEQAFEEPALSNWIAENQVLARSLEALRQAGQLRVRPISQQYATPADFTLDEGELQLWMQFADYLHLTNNRLGILNRDEGFLAYLMMKSME